MKDIFSYLKNYSSISFETQPFNEVDALVLIELTYLNLEGVMKEQKEYSFSEVINSDHKKKLLEGTFVPNLDGRLIQVLSGADRYRNLIFSHPLFEEKPENLVQYFSVVLSDPGKRNYVLFRGTNKTLFGSIEDLLFATRKGPESVWIAVDYLNDILNKVDTETYLIGHSKGGTIAEEAYLSLKDENKKKISLIYDFDGPGMGYPPEGKALEDLSSKTKKFVTKRTIFGLILNNCHEFQIADGKNRGLLHHMVFSWRVEDTHIGIAPKISSDSYRRKKRMNDFVNKLSEEEIIDIIGNSKYLMSESGLFRISDIALVRLWKFIKVYRYAKKHRLLSPNFKEFLFVCKDTFL